MRIRSSILFMILLTFCATPLLAQQTPFTSAIPIPGTVQAENYDRGGNTVAWFDTSAGNAFGVYRFDDMDVGAIPAGGHHIGALANGEWAEYTVNVATSGPYSMTVRYASDYAGPNTFRVLLDGGDLTGSQSIPKTSLTAGDWFRFQTKSITVNLTAGSNRILRVEFTQGAWNFDSLTFAALPTCSGAPVFTAQPQAHEANQPGFAYTLSATVSGATSLQWLRDGVAVAGATTSSLALSNLEQGKDGGNYQLRATNACGTTLSSAARIRVRCSANPELSSENIYRALSGQLDFCYWQEDKHDNFPFVGTDTNGSYNKPVIAGAVAYIKNFPNYRQWWKDYLNGELGNPGAPPNWYYGGEETGSFTYQHYNIASVLGVMLHAHRMGHTDVRDLAWKWLKVTFTIHALSAAPGWIASRHVEQQTSLGAGTYNGPYITLSGERSPWIQWGLTDRSIQFAQAVGFATNLRNEQIHLKNVRTYVEGQWTDPTRNAYGLTSADRTTLRAIVNTGALPANLIPDFLPLTLRTKMRYNIVAWQSPEVVRLTLMEQNFHTATAPTFGVVYFTNARLAGGREAHYVYPWAGVFGGGDAHKYDITRGTGRINLTAGYIEADNAGGSATHPAKNVRISGLPAEKERSYWIVLSPGAAPVRQ